MTHVTRQLVARLGPADLRYLAPLVGDPDAPPAQVAERLAADPARLELLLASDHALAAISPPEDPPGATAGAALVGVSPFLAFTAAIHRAERDLRDARYVEEWAGPRMRVPVLGVDDLRAFLGEPRRRLFLADLLTSYTRVRSGTVWRRARRGWRRQRFSELDPLALAAMLDAAPEAERPRLHRRLGDLALFLTGVFPDHTAARLFRPIDVHRLGRAASEAAPALEEALETRGSVGLLERLGERWYRLAGRTAPAGVLSGDEAADRFAEARRALDHVTHRYLFPVHGSLFPV